jgi:nucleoid-associated protein YgaU
MLEAQNRDLRRQALRLRTRAARQRSRDFRKRLKEALKSAEQQGTIPESELAELLSDAESVLRERVGILNSDPTPKNIEPVLSELEILMLLSDDTEGGASGDAWRAVHRASGKIVERNEKVFRQNPNEANFDKMLQAKTMAQHIGTTREDKPANWRPANTAHVVESGDTLAKISERFYRSPAFWDIIYLENYSLIGDNVRSLRIGTELKIP